MLAPAGRFGEPPLPADHRTANQAVIGLGFLALQPPTLTERRYIFLSMSDENV